LPAAFTVESAWRKKERNSSLSYKNNDGDYALPPEMTLQHPARREKKGKIENKLKNEK